MTKRDLALKVAWSLHNTPYKWGGDDPMQGFDCSGFVVEILKSIGLISRGSDYTAQGLYELFKDREADSVFVGTLVFWGRNRHSITHVEFGIDSGITMGASGGGSKTITTQDAIEQNAYIKIRPVRPGYIKVVSLF